MKLVIIIVIVLVVFGGGGTAGWYFFFRDAGVEAKDEPPPPPETTFLEIDSINVPVIKNGVIQRYVLLRVTLDLRDDSVKQQAQLIMPKLRDSYIRELYGYFEGLPDNSRGIDVRAIKNRLKHASDQIVGQGAVKDILIQGAFERDWKPSN